MPGSGFKDWTTGHVVTESEFDGYVQKQVVMYFADATARDAAITAPEEGMHAYLADTNKVTTYDGATWQETGGIVLSTKGDLLVHTGTGLTRLAKGTDTHLLTADSAAASGVKWAAAPAGDHIEAKATAGAASSESVTWTSAFGSTPVANASPIYLSGAGTAVAQVESTSTTGAQVASYLNSGAAASLVKHVIAREAS